MERDSGGGDGGQEVQRDLNIFGLVPTGKMSALR